MNILIYAGAGTSRVNVLRSSVIAALKYFGINDKYHVKTISPDLLYDTKWMSCTRLLIIPGGRDLPYVKDLTGISLTNIRAFVENGGSYLGLCAGAYFSCSNVIFEKGTAMEVIGKRDLNLFHGDASGSVYHPFVYDSTKGSRIVPVCCEDSIVTTAKTSFAYFNGGCEFLPDNDFSSYCTIATYKEFPKKKAIVCREMGKGKIILSGVHPEMDVRFLDSSEYTAEQWKSMEKHSNEQRELFLCFMKFLLNVEQSIMSNL